MTPSQRPSPCGRERSDVPAPTSMRARSTLYRQERRWRAESAAPAPASNGSAVGGLTAVRAGGRTVCLAAGPGMLHAAIRVLLYVSGGPQPALGFAATLAVMPAGRLRRSASAPGRRGQLVTCSVLVIIGVAATGLEQESDPPASVRRYSSGSPSRWSRSRSVHRHRRSTDAQPTRDDGSKARTRGAAQRLGRALPDGRRRWSCSESVPPT